MSKILAQLYQNHFGRTPASIVPLAAHASQRAMFRLVSQAGTAVGVSNADVPQNDSFVGFTQHFRKHGLPAPEIYGVSDDRQHYLVEDFGNDTLLDVHLRERHINQPSPKVVALYQKAVEYLVKFQVVAGRDIDFSLCHKAKAFDRTAIIKDMQFFLNSFARELIPTLNESAIVADFGIFADFLDKADSSFFLYRDFQARNIMVRKNAAGEDDLAFIDYQDGRRGPLQYDIVSLLYQSKADLPADTRKILLNHYLDALAEQIPVDRERFLHFYHGFIFVRLMQVLGTYGEQGLRQKKEYFKQSIPFALGNLAHLLEAVALPIELPNLRALFTELVEKHRPPELPVARGSLSVNIMSFSYRNGYPVIDTSHGGGFVFDCRCIPNPGREERYKRLTGQDEPVKEYLSQRQEATDFYNHVYAICSQAIESYRSRGFNSLSIAFGCTGGQHRSIYFAERLTHDLGEVHGVFIQLHHSNLENLRNSGVIV